MLSKENAKKETEKVIEWIKDYVEKSGAKGIVVGNSGGKDSATVIALSVKAIGKENVVTVAMPCGSEASDLEDAKLVSDTFDVQLLEIELSDIYSGLADEINQGLRTGNTNDRISKEAEINIKPRLRMTALYAVAQTMGYLVIGTGNLSEIMVGYTTKWGDSACDFNPIANFTVEEVKLIGTLLGVPESIIQKAPDSGLGIGIDEKNLGVKYSQISEYINTGHTDSEAMEKIEKMNKKSTHKRENVPTYPFERKNYLKKLN